MSGEPQSNGTWNAERQRYACQSCRQRKLRCDRKRPCTNCIARSVDCKQQHFSSTGRGIPKPQENSSALLHILSRLDRLEAIVGQAHDYDNETHISTQMQSAPRSSEESDNRTARDAGDGHGSREGNERIRTESGQLVAISANDRTLLGALSHDLSLSVSRSSATSPDSGCGVLDEKYRGPLCAQLPPKEETLRLFQTYFEYIGQFQHILLESHCRDLIEDVYFNVSHVSATTAPRGAALVFSILAISVLLGPFDGSFESMLAVMRDRFTLSAVYIRAAMDCLDQARRRMDHTLENVQALIILFFLINHVESFSGRSCTLMAEAIAVARLLSLHQIDVPAGRRGQSNYENNPVVREVKRRVWWYLTATDWTSSLAGGQGDSIYSVQLRHIKVDIPRNINDEDLAMSDFTEQPFSKPTTMSYFLYRLKAAEIARCISDMVSNDPNSASSEIVISLDSKYDHLLDELPTFFKMEHAHSAEVRAIDEKYSYIPIQRLVITIMINLGRCKLHFPYLVGSTNTALHIFSRHACLKAARSVLGAHRDMSTTNLSHSSDYMKLQGTVHHMFVGAVILATDLCCNRPRGEERERQHSELMRACAVLASLKHHSQIAAKFLESLTALLVKYGVWAQSVTALTREGESMANQDLSQQWQLGDYSLGSSDIEHQDFEVPVWFDDLWGAFVEQPSAMDMIDIF